MQKTPLGLTVLEPLEPLSTDDYSFQAVNPRIIDALLKVGAITHKHDGHAALATPPAPTVSTSDTGGTIPADTTIRVAVSLLDAYGGETLPSPAVTVTTQPAVPEPTEPPTLAANTVAGTLLAGDYAYAVTLVDDGGGETAISPTAFVTIEPGSPTNRVVVSGLGALVTTGVQRWRLWRQVNGGLWNLIAEGTSASFTDDGAECINPNVQPPLEGDSASRSTNTLVVTVPVPSTAAVGYRVYASEEADFGTYSLLGEFPRADAGTPQEFTTLGTLTLGEPLTVATAVAGPSKINAETELSSLSWRAPVAAAGDLPSSGNSTWDVRLVTSEKVFYGWTGAVWTPLTTSTGGGGPAGPAPAGFVGRADFNGPGVPIPDPGGVTQDIVVNDPDELVVHGVKVALWIAHTWDGDLTAILRHPDGTEITLSARDTGGAGWGSGAPDAQRLIFDDNAATDIFDAPGGAPIVGSFRPAQALSALRGKPAAGTWQLVLSDAFAGDDGTLWRASLIFEKDPVPHRIQKDGVDFAARSRLNFTGGVGVTDDAANDRTVVSVLPPTLTAFIATTTWQPVNAGDLVEWNTVRQNDGFTVSGSQIYVPGAGLYLVSVHLPVRPKTTAASAWQAQGRISNNAAETIEMQPLDTSPSRASGSTTPIWIRMTTVVWVPAGEALTVEASARISLNVVLSEFPSAAASGGTPRLNIVKLA